VLVEGAPIATMDKNKERRTRDAATEIVQLRILCFTVSAVKLGTAVVLVQIPKLFSGLGPARKNLLTFGNTKSVVVLAFAEVDRIAHEILEKKLDLQTAK
jgi:hypothetical protein